jgi:hypothetical protein
MTEDEKAIVSLLVDLHEKIENLPHQDGNDNRDEACYAIVLVQQLIASRIVCRELDKCPKCISSLYDFIPTRKTA